MKDGNTASLKKHLQAIHKSQYQIMFPQSVPKKQPSCLELFQGIKKLFLIACSPAQILCSKNKKKALKDTTEATETTTSQPAIIAIEIVDPNENSTSKAKHSKRTIETALGYGYNSYDTSKPRYEIYKYSQHDIPPYKGDSSNNVFKNAHNGQLNVQKSVQYTLPTVTEHVATTSKILRPGMTLYSSLSAKGKLGGLTSSLSHISGLEHNRGPVPVVILRIYPDQLKDSTIQANLPESHPFAKTINSINIQSLLLHYIRALQNPASVNQYSGGQTHQSTYSSSKGYSAPTSNTFNRYPSTSSYYTQNSYQKPARYQSGNTEAQHYQYYQQSYPEEAGYRQNQYQQSQYHQDYNNRVQVQEAPIKYEFRYQSPGPQKQITKRPEHVQPQYYYVQPTTQASYSTEPTQYYQANQQVAYIKEPSVPQVQQYYTTNDQQQYQQYYQAAQEQPQQEYTPQSQKLLTTENFPTDKHTRVVFRTKSGNVRTPESQEASAKEIKTIKIEVPDNIAKVEVQESEKPYYGYEQSYSDSQQAVEQNDPYDQSQGANAYSNQDSDVSQVYSKNDEGTATGSYNYQNIDYEQMVKYFERRGAMPSYFYQQAGDGENGDQSTLPTEDLVSAYEEAAFPSTTLAPEKKKTKSKKRT